MLRTALTIYMVLATLVGPAVCCCSLCPAAAGVGRPFLPAPHRSPATPSPAGCPHCCGQSAPAPDSPSKTPDRDPGRPQKPACPCQSHAAQPALPQAEADGTSVLALLVAFADMISAGPLATWVAVEADLRPSCPAEGVPFLTAQDLLRAHHLLRC
ncbi:MAG: hypothetical protein K2P78_01990 [Gemmataceae bacterium]|nr:hypothetical protein [Gemmataceae bacterium]